MRDQTELREQAIPGAHACAPRRPKVKISLTIETVWQIGFSISGPPLEYIVRQTRIVPTVRTNWTDEAEMDNR